MPGHDIIVIGASAGGVEVLTKLVAGLPSDLSAALFIVVHFPAWGKSILPEILTKSGSLRAVHATDGEAIAHGRIYVAPPDYHLLVKRGFIRLVQGPKENGFRPAVDPLFRTAAKAYGRRVVGVVLSGALDDGTAGLIDVKKQGGVAVVQNPDDAICNGMPRSAIENADVDYILSASSIAPALVRLAREPVPEEGVKTVSSDDIDMEPDIVELDGAGMRSQQPGTLASFACPDCGGTLYQLDNRGFLQYRCRVGHAFSPQSLVAGKSEVEEEALWAAIRSLEERADLMHRMAAGARERNQISSAQRYEAQALEAEQRSELIRQALFQGQLPATEKPTATGQVSNQGQTLSADFKVVVLAAEAGGLMALSQILPALPLNFPAAIIVVQHLDTQSDRSLMTDVLIRLTTLPVKQAQEGEPLRPGMIYTAPLNQLLLVNPNGTFSLLQAVLVDFARPSADLLFQSVAGSFKHRAIAVVLSGTANDGALGVRAIKKMGGKAIAQDESTCEFSEMPNAAIQTGSVDFVLPLNAIASTLVNLVMAG